MYEFKGKSLIEFPDSYTVIDLETTGHNLYYDNIIEISAIRIRDGNIVDRFSSLVRPPMNSICFRDFEGELVAQDCYVPDFVSELTGITNEMLETAPDIDDLLPAFKDFVGDDILVGHNIVAFDANFLCSVFKERMETEFCNDYIDTLRSARWVLKDLQHHRLSDIADYFEIDRTGAHRAEADCIITNNCFVKLRLEAEKQYGSIDDFLAFLAEKRKRKRIRHSLHAKDIIATTDEIDIENPFYGKYCVFTGKLDKMSRKNAMQIVKNLGGENEDRITKKTNFLIVGNIDYSKAIKEGKSAKMKKAEKYMMEGQEIETISEDTFYMMVEE